MYNGYGSSSPWGNSPFQSQNLEQLQNQYRTQLDTIDRMKQAQVQNNILDEINRELGTLEKEEQQLLYESREYIDAKRIYETGLLQFISNRFSQEYVNSAEGKEASLGLLRVIKNSKEKIAHQTRLKNEKINQLLGMLETDPEMKKRYDILTGVKKESEED